MSAIELGQAITAAFTALAALAAWLSVLRVERDRWKRVLPDLHIELLADVPGNQVRLLVVNHGGPVREVRVFGVLGDFGFMGIIPPTSHWQPGEIRTVELGVPLPIPATVHAFVEARGDMGKRYLLVTTAGGATYRWPLRRAVKLAPAEEWRRLFPGVAPPLESPFSPVSMRTIERRY